MMSRDEEVTSSFELPDPPRRKSVNWAPWALTAVILLATAAFGYRGAQRLRAAEAELKDLKDGGRRSSAQLEKERERLEARVGELEAENKKLTQERDELSAARDELTEGLQEKTAAVKKLQAEQEAQAKRAKPVRRRR